ncbi:hypothetical protein [Roseivirga sp. E12]|uniref:hypothetical protein n=1 Tax=Roseivirga sp. E12 TaxID=2819237 RepID=UPI001ABC1266|nr:hypothetical protein [Roseivirga sp. E12]MBO3700404.1 hypothetical protein [Roseivirga sp. E12]
MPNKLIIGLSILLITQFQSVDEIIVSKQFLDQNIQVKPELLQFPKGHFTLVKYLNSGCSTCFVEMELWKDFVIKNDLSSRMDILFVVSGRDRIDIDYVFHKSEFKVSYFYDLEYKFFDDNQISANKDHQTLLLNSNGRIIERGNPVGTSSRSNKFKSLILKSN